MLGLQNRTSISTFDSKVLFEILLSVLLTASTCSSTLAWCDFRAHRPQPLCFPHLLFVGGTIVATSSGLTTPSPAMACTGT